MSKGFLTTRSDLDKCAPPWARSQCPPTQRRRKPLFILFSWFGRTSRRAVQAVRDFVTCFSPQSNKFREGIMTISQETPTDFQESRGETPSTTKARDETPRGDVWSKPNGSRPPAGFVGKPDIKERMRLANFCRSRKTRMLEGRAQNASITPTNMEVDRCTCIAEVPSTSTSTMGPKLPTNFFELPTKSRLRAVKQANKLRPLSRLMATARMIIYKPEPIKCVEAVFLALYLTAGLMSVDRIPLGFKTQFANQVFQHIVVLVQHNGKYGAFGISRSPDLMTKDFLFDSMSSIVENFKTAYEESDHTVLKIRIGLPVEHNIMSPNFVCWRHLCLSPTTQSWPECVEAIEKHASRMRHLWDLWVLAGKGGDPRRGTITRKAPLETGLAHYSSSKKKMTPRELPQHRKLLEVAQPFPTGAPLGPPARIWDAESTGSNTDECEHCEQLKRSVPPDAKPAGTTALKRIKTSAHHDVGTGPLKKSNKLHQGLHGLGHPGPALPPWDIESFESNTGECEQIEALAEACAKTRSRHNNLSLAATKKLLKKSKISKGLSYLVSNSSVLSTPRRNRTPRQKYISKAVDAKSSRSVKLKSRGPGPLYNITAKKSRAG